MPLRLFVIAGLVALVGGIYFWQTQRSVAVRVASAESNVPIRVFGLGIAEARVVSKLGSEVGAQIVELPVDQGDRVKEGDVPARLDPTEQQAKVQMARAGVQSAEANLGKAQAALERHTVILVQKQSTNRRQKELAAKNVASAQVAEEAQHDEDVAAADAAVARSEVAVASTQLEGAKAQLQVDETLLAHHILVAPFDGMVVERLQELGAVVRRATRS